MLLWFLLFFFFFFFPYLSVFFDFNTVNNKMGRGGGNNVSKGFTRFIPHRRHRTQYATGGGSKKNSCCSNMVMTIFLGIFLGILIIAVVVVITTQGRVDDVCDNVDNINKNEQRTCQTKKTEDVKLSEYKTGLMAYRYDTITLPSMDLRKRDITYNDYVPTRDHKYFDFALSAGGMVEFTYTVRGSSDEVTVYVMTPDQYDKFKSRRSKTCEWTSGKTNIAQHLFVAPRAGVYYIVVDNREFHSVRVDEKVKITTEVYKVSETTAKEYCNDKQRCKFKDVKKSETIIVEYKGAWDFADVQLFHGDGSFNKSILVPVIVMCILVLIVLCFFIITLLRVLKKCGKKAKKVAKKAAKSATDDSGSNQQTGDLSMAPTGYYDTSAAPTVTPQTGYPTGDMPPQQDPYNGGAATPVDGAVPSAPPNPSMGAGTDPSYNADAPTVSYPGRPSYLR